MKIITGIGLWFMLILSHIPGKPSSAESRWLSSMTGVREGTLRRSAHVVLYLILAVLVIVGWADTSLWIRIVALVLIAVIDIIALFISSRQGLEVGSFILVIIINCLLIAAAITMKKSFKISQSLLYICFAIDFVQIIIKNPRQPIQRIR